MRLAQRFVLLCLPCIVAATIGCTANPEFKQPSESDSIADLVAIATEKPSTTPAMQSVGKMKAIEILATRGDAGLPGLFQVAQDESQQHTVRFAALDAIGNLQTVPPDRLPDLLKIRRSKEGIVVDKVLARSCKSAARQVAAPLLVEFVKDETIKYEDRQFVAFILVEIDEKAAASAGVVNNANDKGPNLKFMPDIKPAGK